MTHTLSLMHIMSRIFFDRRNRSNRGAIERSYANGNDFAGCITMSNIQLDEFLLIFLTMMMLTS